MKRFQIIGIAIGITMTFAFMGCKHDVASSGNPSGQTQNQTSEEIQYEELPEGTGGTAGTSSKYVYFGEWPQTIKATDVDLTPECKDVGMFKYWKGSDGFWYVNIRENAYHSGYKYSNGTDVGRYGVDDSTGSYRSRYFKVEPIKWRVLTNNYNGKKLLLAEDILINFMFYDYSNVDREGSISPNNYKESRIRAWLNGLSYNEKPSDSENQAVNNEFMDKGFLQTAFTEAQRSAIMETTVSNNARSTNPNAIPLLWESGENSYVCDDTTDKIFLLSEQEVTNYEYYFAAHNQGGDVSARIRKTTDFAKAHGAYQVSSSGECRWWLRSPCPSSQSHAYIVRETGEADYPAAVDFASYGVCPALCLKN
ncbi:MAG: hypothetical protein IKI40_09125 [Treponema sp.]|nr:hypothetical protein [Treponema sp.]